MAMYKETTNEYWRKAEFMEYKGINEKQRETHSGIQCHNINYFIQSAVFLFIFVFHFLLSFPINVISPVDFQDEVSKYVFRFEQAEIQVNRSFCISWKM